MLNNENHFENQVENQVRVRKPPNMGENMVK